MTNRNELIKKNIELNDLCTNCERIFNLLSIKIGDFMTQEFPSNYDLRIYNSALHDIIKNNSKEPISVFTVYIYNNDIYRTSIINGDEVFFKNEKHDHLTENDQDRVKALFNFQNVWDKMNIESHQFIKQSMNKLVSICERYVSLKDNINNVQKQLELI